MKVKNPIILAHFLKANIYRAQNFQIKPRKGRKLLLFIKNGPQKSVLFTISVYQSKRKKQTVSRTIYDIKSLLLSQFQFINYRF